MLKTAGHPMRDRAVRTYSSRTTSIFGPGCAGARITPRIPRRGIETGERLGRHRWIIERSLAWLTGYRRLTLRSERSAKLFTAFLTPAAALTFYKKLAM
jgi:Transposase DDE domain